MSTNLKPYNIKQNGFQVRYGLTLLLGFIVLWWLCEVTAIIPRNFLGLNLHGGLLIIFIIAAFRQLCKNSLHEDGNLTIWKLVKECTLSILIAQLILQFLRQLWLADQTIWERLRSYIASVSGMTLLGCVFAFLIAYHLKVRNTKMLFLFIGVFVLIMFGLQRFVQ